MRLARSARLFDSVGTLPPDADVLILEADALDYREALARGNVSPAPSLIARLTHDVGRPLREDSTGERLLGRTLLRLLAEKSEETARWIETEICRHQPSAQTEACDDPFLYRDKFATFDPSPSPEIQPLPGPTLTNLKQPPRVGREVEPEHPLVASGEAGDDTLFDAAWAEAAEDLITTKRWDRGKAALAESSRKRWLGIIGDKPLQTITCKTAVKFRRTVSQLPEKYYRDKRWRSLTIVQMIIAANVAETAGKTIERMTVKTVDRHISQLKQPWGQLALLDLVCKDLPDPHDRLYTAIRKARQEVRESASSSRPRNCAFSSLSRPGMAANH